MKVKGDEHFWVITLYTVVVQVLQCQEEQNILL